MTEIVPEVMELLQNYDFPGNVRELENIMERDVAMATEHTLGIAQLSDDLRTLNTRTFRRQDGKIPSWEEIEQDYIQWVLEETKGNQTLAAQIMGIDRVSLWHKLRKFNKIKPV